LQIELAEEKPQSLHSQQSPQWAEQMYVTKEKNCYPECHKKFCMQARNILTNLSLNPARVEKPGPTYNSGLESVLLTQCLKNAWHRNNQKPDLMLRYLNSKNTSTRRIENNCNKTTNTFMQQNTHAN